MVLISTLMWVWWGERNNIREGGKRKETETLAHIVTTTAADYCQVFIKKKEGYPGTRKIWRKPHLGVVKINTDAAFSELSHSRGWGACARDHHGEVIFIAAGKIEKALDSFHAELIAASKGIRAAMDYGMNNIMIETDALMVKQATDGDTYDFVSCGKYYLGSQAPGANEFYNVFHNTLCEIM